MDVRFVILSSPKGTQRTVSVRLPLLVGRADEAKFRIPHDGVSRRHCEFFVADGRVHLRDLGSTNGTVIDGHDAAAHTAVPVPPGATIRIGSVTFRVDYEPDADLADTRPLQPLPPPTVAVEPPAVEPEPPVHVAPPAIDAAAPVAAAPPNADLGWLPAEPRSTSGPDDERLDEFFKSLR